MIPATTLPDPSPDDRRLYDLYRMHDISGRLLYVGVSNAGLRRFGEHSKDKTWWREVSRIDVEHAFCTRSVIEQMERDAIKAEQPLYNVVHNADTGNTFTPSPPPLTREQLKAWVFPTGKTQDDRDERNRFAKECDRSAKEGVIGGMEGPEIYESVRDAANARHNAFPTQYDINQMVGRLVHHPEYGNGEVRWSDAEPPMVLVEFQPYRTVCCQTKNLTLKSDQ